MTTHSANNVAGSLMLGVPVESMPRKTISVEHKARMKAGRLAKQATQDQATRVEMHGGAPNQRSHAGPTLGASQKKRLSQMPETMRSTYLKAVSGKSLAAAVKAHCQECVGYQKDEVTKCTSTACPLYHYRPYQKD